MEMRIMAEIRPAAVAPNREEEALSATITTPFNSPSGRAKKYMTLVKK
jgi:hypothetical protein